MGELMKSQEGPGSAELSLKNSVYWLHEIIGPMDPGHLRNLCDELWSHLAPVTLPCAPLLADTSPLTRHSCACSLSKTPKVGVAVWSPASEVNYTGRQNQGQAGDLMP